MTTGARRGARCLIVGLDGACWSLVDRFMEEGRMPFLSSLLAQGCRGALNSTTPPMTLPSWASILTGCNPGKHGIFDFVQRIPGTWDLRFVDRRDRRTPGLHRILGDAGGTVACVAMPTTWPPEPLRGLCVAGFDSPVATSIDRTACSPPELYEELHRRFGGLKFADFQETRTGPDWHMEARSSLLAEIDRKERIGRWLLG
ncbi:MAG: alkaline phosphatase family protein, partial [Myxococcota bacterium]|nr:alkaline phosphatase family protein [Myxococcota bacterium]